MATTKQERRMLIRALKAAMPYPNYCKLGNDGFGIEEPNPQYILWLKSFIELAEALEASDPRR